MKGSKLPFEITNAIIDCVSEIVDVSALCRVSVAEWISTNLAEKKGPIQVKSERNWMYQIPQSVNCTVKINGSFEGRKKDGAFYDSS